MEAKLERMTAMYEAAVSQVEALQAENARLKAQLAVRPASGAGTGAGAGAAASPRRRKRLSVSRGMGLSTRGMIGRDNGSNNGSNRSLRAGSIDSSGSLTRARGWSVDGNQHGDFRMRVTFLKSVPLFHSLSEDQLERLAVKMQAQRFDDDKVIVLQGDEGNQFFVIVEGRVRTALCVCVSVHVCLCVSRTPMCRSRFTSVHRATLLTLMEPWSPSSLVATSSGSVLSSRATCAQPLASPWAPYFASSSARTTSCRQDASRRVLLPSH